MSKILKKYHCSIPDYPTEIRVSNKRREKFWKDGETLPKKHAGATLRADGFYVDALDERITKNTKTAGKPRMLTINAQKIYVGIHHAVRSKIVEELHSVLGAAFKAQLPSKIILNGNKILIHLHFYEVYTIKIPDLDNLSNLFVKCGIDCLTEKNNPNQSKSGYTHKLGIIPDDKASFIPYIVVEFSNVPKPEDRKLDFNLYEVETEFTVEGLLDREIIKNICEKQATS
jgi:hypothetical protein